MLLIDKQILLVVFMSTHRRQTFSYLDSPWEGEYATVLLYLRYLSARGHQKRLDPRPPDSVSLNLQESGSRSSTRGLNHLLGAQMIPFLEA